MPQNVNYKNAHAYYFFSLFQTRLEKVDKIYVDKVRSLGGAGYELGEGDKTHIVAFVFTDERELAAARSEYIGFETGAVYLFAPRLSSFSKKLTKRGAFKEAFDFISSLNMTVSNLEETFKSDADSHFVYESLEKISLKASHLYQVLFEASDGLELSQREAFLIALENSYQSIERCMENIYQESMILSSLNFLKVEVCLNDVFLHEKLA